jgi:hypothetical protein
MSSIRIYDNGVYRNMTQEEIAAWEAECAEYIAQQEEYSNGDINKT